MADSGESTQQNVKICIKTPKEKKEIELEEDASIDKVKELVAKAFNASTAQLCLIFAGKILKEGDTLKQHNIKDGHTIHLVIKSNNRTTDTPTSPSSSNTTATSGTGGGTTQTPPNISQSPFGLGALGGLGGMADMGMGSVNFMEMQQRMQSEMMRNPEMMRQMMDNPMVQSLMSNPDVMRQMITANPQMRELMERNPEITHMLNNPDLMRQTMELARNPSMLQELMRSQDRAMSNLESIPGGFNALQRMYRDVQEPMMNAAQEGFGSNPFAALAGQGGTGNTQQGRENSDPLPNPWAPPAPASSASSGGGTTQTSTTTTPGTGGTSTTGMPAGMFNSPGMQSLMGQMSQNPQLMQNMLQAPYMQSMLQAMSANPDMAQTMLSANPMFASNPQLQEYMRTMMPTFLQQMQNPEVQGMMTNPRALQAMMQIQQGMAALQQEAPGFAQTSSGLSSSLGVPGVPGAPGSAFTPVTATTTAAGSDSTTPTTTTTTPPTTAANTAPTPAQQQDQFSTFMSQMVNMMGNSNISQAPEQRFAAQLEQMAAMGFVDRQANIQALVATFGDVNAAIDRLLQQR